MIYHLAGDEVVVVHNCPQASVDVHRSRPQIYPQQDRYNQAVHTVIHTVLKVADVTNVIICVPCHQGDTGTHLTTELSYPPVTMSPLTRLQCAP